MSASGNSQNQESGPDAPKELRARVRQLKADIDSSYIQLGRDLYLIYHRKLYEGWGHDTFTDYVENEVGMSQSRAERCRRIWTKFVVKEGISPKALDGLGYTNALALLPVLGLDVQDDELEERDTKDWIERAKKLSWRALELEVKKYTGISAAQKQALVNAGAKITTDMGDTPNAPEPISQIDDRRHFNHKLHPSQWKVVDAAMAEAKRSKPDEMADSEALAHMATEFLAARMSKEEEPVARVEFLLHNLEHVYGGKFVWIPGNDAATYLAEKMQERPDLFTTPTEEDEE